MQCLAVSSVLFAPLENSKGKYTPASPVRNPHVLSGAKYMVSKVSRLFMRRSSGGDVGAGRATSSAASPPTTCVCAGENCRAWAAAPKRAAEKRARVIVKGK